MDLSLKELARKLQESNNYQILERFERVQHYNKDDGSKKLIGIYLDIETTGLNYTKDKIIELALVSFEYNQDGQIFRIVNSYASFQDPKEPISEEISLLTNITDDMVKDQMINKIEVESMVESASLIIAHNASFDRKFIEKQFPIFREKSWGCSYTQVPWREENILSANLEYLAYKFGIFYDAHRAEIDCLVGIHLLTKYLPKSKELVLKTLLKKANENSYIIWATNSPFHTKDILKSRGYRWNDGSNGKPKSWYIEVSDKQKESEYDFLCQLINQSKEDFIVEEMNSFSRFAIRD